MRGSRNLEFEGSGGVHDVAFERVLGAELGVPFGEKGKPAHRIGDDRPSAIDLGFEGAEPRTAVPAGSVGLAGEFTGVYPAASPGGWQLLGVTDLRLWDVGADEPALLGPGTRLDGPEVVHTVHEDRIESGCKTDERSACGERDMETSGQPELTKLVEPAIAVNDQRAIVTGNRAV